MISGCVERYHRRPLERLFSGFDLSVEEFYLLRAIGAVTAIISDLGISPVNEFEAFRLLHYEDDDTRCFINPSLPQREEGKVGLRFGISPEELSRRALRPEQKDFFRKHLPDVFQRFRE